MELKKIKEIIKKELPLIMQSDEEISRFILRLSSQYYAGKIETEDRFERILNELQKNREEQKQERAKQDERWAKEDQKWEEYRQERAKQDQKWKEQKQKWEEQNKKWWKNQEKIEKLYHKYDQSMGAIGARWGVNTEASFRNGLAGILEEYFKVKVLHVTEFDDKGEVFCGRPDQIELDLLVKNGLLIICEIKSSLSRSQVHIFDRKAKFYEKLHGCTADRKMIISPMVTDRAKTLADQLGIKIYSYVQDIKEDKLKNQS